jgi:hypothetical protein
MRHPERLKALALLLRMELVKRDWSETKFGIEIGMPQRTLSDRLNCKSDWRYEELQAISDVLYDGDVRTVFSTLEAINPFATAPVRQKTPSSAQRRDHKKASNH